MVFQNQGSGEVIYEEVKGKILAAAENRIGQAAPTPMDIGEFNGEAKEETAEAEQTGEVGPWINCVNTRCRLAGCMSLSRASKCMSIANIVPACHSGQRVRWHA